MARIPIVVNAAILTTAAREHPETKRLLLQIDRLFETKKEPGQLFLVLEMVLLPKVPRVVTYRFALFNPNRKPVAASEWPDHSTHTPFSDLRITNDVFRFEADISIPGVYQLALFANGEAIHTGRFLFIDTDAAMQMPEVHDTIMATEPTAPE